MLPWDLAGVGVGLLEADVATVAAGDLSIAHEHREVDRHDEIGSPRTPSRAIQAELVGERHTRKHAMKLSKPSAYLRTMACWTTRRVHVGAGSRRSDPVSIGRRVADAKGWLVELGTTAGLLVLSVGLFVLGVIVGGVLFTAFVAGLESVPVPPGTAMVVLIGGSAVGLVLLFALPFVVTVVVSKVIEVGEGWARTRAARRRSEPTVELRSREQPNEEVEPIERPR